MIRYLITDGSAARSEESWRAHLQHKAYGQQCVDFIQIREPDLDARNLARLTRCLISLRAENRGSPKILINDRSDIALACNADGVHLRRNSIAPQVLRHVVPNSFTISVACHDLADVQRAHDEGADYALLAPIFPPISKVSSRPALGLEVVHKAAQLRIPVIALGGITEENAAQCMQAGAAGIAGISLFRASA